jgi:hypothetical protein
MPQDLAKIGLTLNEVVEAKMDDWEYEQHVSALVSLREGNDYFQWGMGKVALSAEGKWGDSIIKSLSKDTGVSERSLYDYRKAYRKFGEQILQPVAELHTALPFKAYVEAVKTETDDNPNAPEEWINRAAEEGWTANQLSREIRQTKTKTYASHEHDWNNWKICNKCGLREEV